MWGQRGSGGGRLGWNSILSFKILEQSRTLETLLTSASSPPFHISQMRRQKNKRETFLRTYSN